MGADVRPDGGGVTTRGGGVTLAELLLTVVIAFVGLWKLLGFIDMLGHCRHARLVADPPTTVRVVRDGMRRWIGWAPDGVEIDGDFDIDMDVLPTRTKVGIFYERRPDRIVFVGPPLEEWLQ